MQMDGAAQFSVTKRPALLIAGIIHVLFPIGVCCG
jgi:hypothetical protein